jgi:O-antigen ligase
VSTTVSVLGIIAASLCAAGAIVAPSQRARALAMLGAVVLTPVLLVAEIWDTPQLDVVRNRPAVAVVGALAGAAAMGALAVFFAKRPNAFPIAAVAMLPFRIPIEAAGSTANLLVPLYVVIGAGSLAWIARRLHGADAPQARTGALEWLLAGSLALYGLQAAYSTDVPKALSQVVFFYVPFTLLFVALRDVQWTPRVLRSCLGVLAALALVFVGIGYWEYATREVLFNPKVIASNQFQEYFRVNSLFFDPSIYGRFLAIVMLALAAVLLWTRDRRTLLLTALGLAVLWSGLVLTLSQSSFTALLAGLATLSMLRFRARWTLGAMGVGVVAAAVLAIGFPGAVGLQTSPDRTLDDATSGRVELLGGGLALAERRPVHGWGSGAFEHEFRRQERTGRGLATAASHTIPVTVAAEQGVIGLALYLALLVAALARLLRGAKVTAARAAVAAGFVALVAHTLMYAAFLEDPLTWALLGAGVALVAATPRPTRRQPDASALVAR